MSSKPSVINIIKTDFIVMVGLLAPAIILALALDDKYLGLLSGLFSRERIDSGESHEFFFIFSIGLAAILIPFSMHRIYCFHKWFGNSALINGIVTAVPYTKDRGTFKYRYTYNGQEYSSSNFVHRTKSTGSIQPGQEIDIVVYKNNPNRAFIRKLYISK